MMGQHSRSEALFYYLRLEDQVPETHLLRLIDKHISFTLGTRGETRYYFSWHERLQAGGTRVSLEFQLPTVGSRAGWKVDQHGLFSQLRSVERPGHPAIHNHVRSG